MERVAEVGKQREPNPALAGHARRSVSSSRHFSAASYLQQSAGNQAIQELLRSVTKPMSDIQLSPANVHANSGSHTQSHAASNINRFGSSNHPLDAPVRTTMESAFGTDLGDVRIHRDSHANEAAGLLHARAFTVGQDIYFGHSMYAPGSPDGFKLLAHELAHTLQQPRGFRPTSLGALRMSTPSDASEREAESMADQVVGGSHVSLGKPTPVAPQIQGDWLDDAKSALSGAYDSTASTVGGAVSTVASAVGEAYNTVASTIGAGVNAVAEGVQSAVSTVKSVGKVIGSVASGAGDTLSADPEQTRANLISRVNATRNQVQSADPNTVNATPKQIGSLNDHLSQLNSVLPADVAVVPLVDPGAVEEGQEAAPFLIPAIVTALEAIAVALGLTVGQVILLIAVIILAIIAIIAYFFSDSTGEGTRTKPKTDPQTKDDPKKEKKPDGPLGPDLIPPVCSPTGFSPVDAIPMTWFKPVVDDYYPRQSTLGGTAYGRDDPPTHLPRGEPIGVESQYWPSVGKTFQIIPEVRGPGAGRFRAVLERYGFDWTGLQADHVQDIEFSGPDDSGFVNLWPMDSSANQSAGARTQGQTIRMCIGQNDVSPVVGTLSELKDSIPNFYGRFFRIRDITR